LGWYGWYAEGGFFADVDIAEPEKKLLLVA